MRALIPAGIGFALLTAPAPSALAQSGDSCGQFSWSIAREQKAFESAALPTVRSGAQYPGMLEAVTVALEPQDKVTYPQPPARAPKSNPAFGAVLVAPPIAVAGTYQVTLSDEAWLDLVQNGAKVKTAGFSGKTGCPSVRKTIRFRLEPGPLTIEISDSQKASIKLDVLTAE